MADDHAANTSTTGVVNPLTGATNGVLETVGDHDYYKFTVTQGGKYTIQVADTGLSDPYLYFRDHTGDLIASDDDGHSPTLYNNAFHVYAANTSGSLNSKLIIDLPAGTYYVDVGAYNENKVGGYQISSTGELFAIPEVEPATPTRFVPLSEQMSFATQAANLLRAAPNATGGSEALSANFRTAGALAEALDAGHVTAIDAQAALLHLADATVSVAEMSYAFFTGKTPTAAGLNYLVRSEANANDLNDAFYASLTPENRFINFAVNLGTSGGAGAAHFAEGYGGLSLHDAVAKAYAEVFGMSATDAKVDTILDTIVPDGRGGSETRAAYFAELGGGSAAGQKAAAVGFLMSESVKAGFGAYQQADLHFLQDLAHGTAVHGVDLLAVYGPTPMMIGQATLDMTILA